MTFSFFTQLDVLLRFGFHTHKSFLYPFRTNVIFQKAIYNKVRMVHCNIEGSQFIILEKYCIFSPKVDIALANSADPDELPQYVVFHLAFHCLPKFLIIWVEVQIFCQKNPELLKFKS